MSDIKDYQCISVVYKLIALLLPSLFSLQKEKNHDEIRK